MSKYTDVVSDSHQRSESGHPEVLSAFDAFVLTLNQREIADLLNEIGARRSFAWRPCLFSSI